MKRIVAVAAAVAILAVAFIPFMLPSESATDFSAYSSSHRGLSLLRREAGDRGEVRSIITSPAVLADEEAPERSLYVAVGIHKDYSDVEVDTIVEFVKNGGSVILADDGGYGNTLAFAFMDAMPEGNVLGFSGCVVYSQESGRPLSSVQMRFARGRYQLPLSSPTALFAQGKDTEALAVSDTDDFTDWDRDGKGEIGEVGMVPLAASFSLGAGRGVLLGDPDLLTNAVLKNVSIGNFTDSLLDWLLPDGGTIYFDESVHKSAEVTSVDRFVMGLALATYRGSVTYLLVAVTVVGVAIILLSRQDPRPWEHRFDLGRYRGSPVNFADRKRMQETLRRELVSKMEETTGLLEDDLVKFGDAELSAVLGDPLLVKLFKGRRLSQKEMEDAVDNIRRWTHG